MKSSLRRAGGAVLILVALILSGCATPQRQNVSYMPQDQYQQGGQNPYAGSGSSRLAEMECPGLWLTKRQYNLQTLLCLGNEVATETLLGTEILETFYGQGWTQVTHADANNQTAIDILCRLGAIGEKVSAQCLSSDPRAPAKSTGTITVNEVTIARVGGIERARNTAVGIVVGQCAVVINEVVEKRQSGHR